MVVEIIIFEEEAEVIIKAEEVVVFNGNSNVPVSNGNSSGNPQNFGSNSYSRMGNERPTCIICGKYGHSAGECRHRGNFAYQGYSAPQNLFAMMASGSHGAGILGESPWYF